MRKLLLATIAALGLALTGAANAQHGGHGGGGHGGGWSGGGSHGGGWSGGGSHGGGWSSGGSHGGGWSSGGGRGWNGGADWRGGGARHFDRGFHHGFAPRGRGVFFASFGLLLGAPYWWPDYYAYPAYGYASPSAAYYPADTGATPYPEAPAFQYYCPDQGYYPQVPACPRGWLRVVPERAVPSY